MDCRTGFKEINGTGYWMENQNVFSSGNRIFMLWRRASVNQISIVILPAGNIRISAGDG